MNLLSKYIKVELNKTPVRLLTFLHHTANELCLVVELNHFGPKFLLHGEDLLSVIIVLFLFQIISSFENGD